MNKTVIVLVWLATIACLAQFPGCNNEDESINDKNVEEGFQLSKKHCGSCHLLPPPHLLNKTTWAEFVLPNMAGFLGFQRFASDYISVSDSAEVMTLEQWRNIVRYYVEKAPDELETSEGSQKIENGISLFKVEMPPTGIRNPATTMVKIDSAGHEITFGDGLTESLYTFQQLSPNKIDSVKVGTGISHVHRNDSSRMILTMGVLYPSDAKNGRLTQVVGNHSFVLIDSLQRPVHARYTDLNADNLEDIIVCEFGNTTGQLCWFERKAPTKFIKHVLRAYPGSVRTEIYDFNKDGRPDVMALMAQGDEGFFIYYNQGNGIFKEQNVLRLLPSHGSNYFELIDWNKDGFPDILASNGDNGDYPPIFKPYHGIRLYLNDGKNKFSEKFFLPVNGVGKVVARDFDSDGDFDLASIAYFPDYQKTPEESFVWWRNDGNLEFRPYSFAESTSGRWLTMDANDLDGDGDIDIVLGNAKFSLGAVPARFMKKWEIYSPSVLILRNTIKH